MATDYSKLFENTIYKPSYTPKELSYIEDPVFGRTKVPDGFKLIQDEDGRGMLWADDLIINPQLEKPKERQNMEITKAPEEDNGEINKETNNSKNYSYYPVQIKDAHRKAAQYFLNKKDKNGKLIFTPEQVSGIVGNLMQESNMNPSIVNKSSGAFGLAQWLGPRKKKLFQKYGTNPSFEQQLDFIWDELNTSEISAFKHLLNTKTSDEAADSIMNMFERPSKKERNESEGKRRNNAKSILAEIANI